MAMLNMSRRLCEKGPTTEHASKVGGNTMENDVRVHYGRPPNKERERNGEKMEVSRI